MRCAAAGGLAVLLSLVGGVLAGTGEKGSEDGEPETAAESPLARGGSAEVREPRRVGGDMTVRVERSGDVFRSGTAKIDTPLPEGYPPPTPPGAIEIKDYPVVRRAQVSGSSDPDEGRDGAFWPLFRHIQSRDIEMTSPVEIDYEGLTGAEDSAPDGWTMSFLYRRTDQGPTGQDRTVEVVDAAPVTVVALGYQGSYDIALVKDRLRQLELWLERSSEWERAGEPRSMFYNGPTLFWNRKWAEVQIPVKPRAAEPEAEGAGDDAEPAEDARQDPSTNGGAAR